MHRHVPSNNPYFPRGQDTIEGLRVYFQQRDGSYTLAAFVDEYLMRDRVRCAAAKLDAFNAYEFYFDFKICQ